MGKEANLKVIFFERAAEGKAGAVIADGYFSFVPTFREGDSINIVRSRKGEKNAVMNNPLGHKTHRILATDWIVTVDEASKDAVATLIVSVAKIEAAVPSDAYPSVVGTHA